MKTNRLLKTIMVFLLVFSLSTGVISANNDQTHNDDATTEITSDKMNHEERKEMTRGNVILGDLVGVINVSNLNPLTNDLFSVDLQLNSLSNGIQAEEGVKNYAVHLTIPSYLEIVDFPQSNGLYTVSPAQPQPGDQVTISFNDERAIGSLLRLHAEFKFKPGTTIPADIFNPNVELTADNMNGVVLDKTVVTPKNIAAPKALDGATTEEGDPVFVHTSTIDILPENSVGGLNREDVEVMITFPSEANIISVMYEGQNYPVETLADGTQVAKIAMGNHDVLDDKKVVEFTYSYQPVETGQKKHKIKIDYKANRYGLDEAVQDYYELEETVGAGTSQPISKSMNKSATNPIYRQAQETIEYKVHVQPISGFKDLTLIDDPQQENEVDFFEGQRFSAIRWEAKAGKNPLKTGKIKTEIFYDTFKNPGTWNVLSVPAYQGNIALSSLNLDADDYVTRFKFVYSYEGSNIIPPESGSVDVFVESQTTTGITNAGTSFDDGITNTVYVSGEKEVKGGYEVIQNNSDSQLLSQTTYKYSGPNIGFAGWESPFYPGTLPHGEEFNFELRFHNVGSDKLNQPVAYFIVDGNIEIKNVTVNGMPNADIEIVEDPHSDKHVIRVTYDQDMPNWGWGNDFGRVRITGMGRYGTSAQINTFLGSNDLSQKFEKNNNYFENVPVYGRIRVAEASKWRTVNFVNDLRLDQIVQASTNGGVYTQTANAVLGQTDGFYMLKIKNKGQAKIDEMHVIAMLPIANDSMVTNESNKKSDLFPKVVGVINKNTGTLSTQEEVYYSVDATPQANREELVDFNQVSSTWVLWDTVSPLPDDTVALKIVKKDGLDAAEDVAYDIKVELPTQSDDVKVAWMAISAGGEFEENGTKYLLPGEPLKAGIYLSSEVADRELEGKLFIDENGNGIYDTNEPLLKNREVRLYDWNDSLVNSFYSDNQGSYKFRNLYPKPYRVEIDTPIAHHPTEFHIGNDKTIDNDFAFSIGNKAMSEAYVNLKKEAEPKHIDAGFVKFGHIGDYVWEDGNENGIQDSNEKGIKDVSLTLVSVYDDQSETVVMKTKTDANGKYEFRNVKPGSYRVDADYADKHYKPSPSHQGTNTNRDSKFDEDFKSEVFVLNSGESIDNIDLGLIRSVGSIEFKKTDANNNPLAGALFGLWHDGEDTDVVAPMMQTTSGVNGFVFFNNLIEGDYQLKEIAAPTGYDLDSTVYPIKVDGTELEVVHEDIKNDETVIVYNGRITLTKVDEQGQGLQGAVFGIWEQHAQNQAPIATASSQADGLVEFININQGTYTIKEITAPQGYILGNDTYQAVITPQNLNVDLGNVINKRDMHMTDGSIQIHKVDETDHALQGAVFGLWDGNANPAVDQPLQKLTSDSDGLIEFENLTEGIYRVEEIQAPEGYQKSNISHRIEVSVDDPHHDLGKWVNFIQTNNPETPSNPEKPGNTENPENTGHTDKPQQMDKNPQNGSSNLVNTGSLPSTGIATEPLWIIGSMMTLLGGLLLVIITNKRKESH